MKKKSKQLSAVWKSPHGNRDHVTAHICFTLFFGPPTPTKLRLFYILVKEPVPHRHYCHHTGICLFNGALGNLSGRSCSIPSDYKYHVRKCSNNTVVNRWRFTSLQLNISSLLIRWLVQQRAAFGSS